MKILITGAAGFVGKNLSEALACVRDGKDRTRGVAIEKLWLYDVDTDRSVLEEGCREADFVVNLAGVNRPKDASEFMKGNFGFASELLSLLEAAGNKCPVLLSSSIPATLIGRYDRDYGRSEGAGVPLSESFRQVVQTELQQCGCDFLQQYCERSSDNRERSRGRA